MTFYGVSIPKYTQANLILSCERDELQIPAGLQDRVIQAYEGLVYMDFDKSVFEKRGYGIYEQLDTKLLPPLYIAYREDLSEISGKIHNKIRERFERGEPLVVSAMQYWARLTDKIKSCLLKGEKEKIANLLNANFDRRKKIYAISPRNLQLVEDARSVGASAKFTGSGGAIVGTYKDEKMFSTLKKRLRKLKVKIIKPQIAIAQGRT
jgi:glucuronokinase